MFLFKNPNFFLQDLFRSRKRLQHLLQEQNKRADRKKHQMQNSFDSWSEPLVRNTFLPQRQRQQADAVHDRGHLHARDAAL